MLWVRGGLFVRQVFGIETLHELCRYRPTSPATLASITGMSSVKIAKFGVRVMQFLRTWSSKLKLATDVERRVAAVRSWFRSYKGTAPVACFVLKGVKNKSMPHR